MKGVLELHAYIGLSKLFAERGWPNPRMVEIEGDITGPALMEVLGIPDDRVESLIVNRRSTVLDTAILHPGDRVALVPPGVPGPHRLLLGIYNKDAKKGAGKPD